MREVVSKNKDVRVSVRGVSKRGCVGERMCIQERNERERNWLAFGICALRGQSVNKQCNSAEEARQYLQQKKVNTAGQRVLFFSESSGTYL